LKRLLFGGSFDPVHAGHLHVAVEAGRTIGADRVVLMPANVPPHKGGQSRAPAEHRLAMLRLAVAHHPSLEVATDELDRGGVSYTIDTVEGLLAGRFAGDSLALLLGQDSLGLLPEWRRVRDLAALVPFVVVPRPTAPEPDWAALAEALGAAAVETMRGLWLPVTPLDVSSSDIRRRAREGRSIRCRVPDPVADYIEAHGIYSRGPAGDTEVEN
jgi:nicotinate-nucleotide adenylyltransferase